MVGANAEEKGKPRDVKVRDMNFVVACSPHFPSMLIFVILLTQLVSGAATCPRPMLARDEAELKLRCYHTAFEPGIGARCPGVLDAAAIVYDMQLQLDGLGIPDVQWASLVRKFRQIPLHELQLFTVHMVLRGHEVRELGPQWCSQKRRAYACAAFGMQRAAANSKRGLDHLLPAGLGAGKHLQLACGLSSPFAVPVVCDEDLKFAARATAIFGPFLPAFRNRQEKVLQKVERELVHLSSCIEDLLPSSLAKVAKRKRPAMIAFLTSILKWPDREQARSFVTGFRLVGNIENAGVFRQLSRLEASEISASFENF